jgi:hypothetical protein
MLRDVDEGYFVRQREFVECLDRLMVAVETEAVDCEGRFAARSAVRHVGQAAKVWRIVLAAWHVATTGILAAPIFKSPCDATVARADGRLTKTKHGFAFGGEVRCCGAARSCRRRL